MFKRNLYISSGLRSGLPMPPSHVPQSQERLSPAQSPQAFPSHPSL